MGDKPDIARGRKMPPAPPLPPEDQEKLRRVAASARAAAETLEQLSDLTSRHDRDCALRSALTTLQGCVRVGRQVHEHIREGPTVT